MKKSPKALSKKKHDISFGSGCTFNECCKKFKPAFDIVKGKQIDWVSYFYACEDCGQRAMGQSDKKRSILSRGVMSKGGQLWQEKGKAKADGRVLVDRNHTFDRQAYINKYFEDRK